MERLTISRTRFLEVARRLALVAPALTACAGSNTPATNASHSPATSQTSAAGDDQPPPDPTVGGGPCRCSWDGNAAAASRVCKRGEINYDGESCIPGVDHEPTDEGYGMPVPGPLPPPDLPA
jgi:hypothetical protein